MTDGQTSLMQPADSTRFEPAHRFGAAEAAIFSAPSSVYSAEPLPYEPPEPSDKRRPSVTYLEPHLSDCFSPSAVRQLVTLLLQNRSDDALSRLIDTYLALGLSPEHLMLRLLQPAARRLGEMWLDDTCTFVDVTLAVSALHGGMRYLGPRFHQDGRPAQRARVAVLGTLDGDQHTFGLAMTAEFFRRSGWTVFAAPSGEDEMADRLRGERNAVVGFSASRADQIPQLAAAIRRMRQLGQHRVAGVVVGGPLLATHPDLARETGADAAGLDAPHALAEAERLATARTDE